jgi:hypothetical protein
MARTRFSKSLNAINMESSLSLDGGRVMQAMPRRVVTLGLIALLFPSLASAGEFEGARSGPVQTFGPQGRLIYSGSYKNVRFRAYLESRRPHLTSDSFFYSGTSRIEIIGQDTIRWNFVARCGVAADLVKASPLGICYREQGHWEAAQQCIDVDLSNDTPANAEKGWYNLWWAVCKDQIRKF